MITYDFERGRGGGYNFFLNENITYVQTLVWSDFSKDLICRSFDEVLWNSMTMLAALSS